MIRRPGPGVFHGMKAMLAPLLPVLALGLVASHAHAAADDVCVPEADVAPQWWNPALSAQKKESRWERFISLR